MPVAGVPPKMPVDGLKARPEGSTPPALSVGVGAPVAVTVKEPSVFTVNVTLFALVIVGANSEPMLLPDPTL